MSRVRRSEHFTSEITDWMHKPVQPLQDLHTKYVAMYHIVAHDWKYN